MDLPPAHKVADLTGPGSTDRYGIGGTDLGVMAARPGGGLVAVFGDTFDGAGVGGRGWRSPVVLFGERAGRGALTWTGSAGRGKRARQIVRYRRGGRRGGHRVTTILPTDVVAVDGSLYLHVMVCEGLGTVHRTEILRSDDGGSRWVSTPATFPGGLHGGLFQMLSWELGEDGNLYAVSTGFRRDAGLLLHRVAADRLTDPIAWQSWGPGPDGWAWGGLASPVLPGAFGELCLRRVQGRWLLVAFDAGHYRIDVRALPDGPTTDLHRAPRATLLHGCAWGAQDHTRGRVAQLYGGYVVPGSSLDCLDLVVSQWNTGAGWPYRVMQFRADITGWMVGLGDTS